MFFVCTIRKVKNINIVIYDINRQKYYLIVKTNSYFRQIYAKMDFSNLKW